ncbi:hypothetical protein AB0C21_08435 [Spirillospora sp. NPDC049024]
MSVVETLPIIYTAHSKLSFFCRDTICEYVLRKQCVPLNPFRLFDYFLGDRVERDLVRRGNNNVVRIADETWVFGEVSNGVLFEIQYATDLGKPVRYFTIGTRREDIKEIEVGDVRFERGALKSVGFTESEGRRAIEASLLTQRR